MTPKICKLDAVKTEVTKCIASGLGKHAFATFQRGGHSPSISASDLQRKRRCVTATIRVFEVVFVQRGLIKA